MGKRRKRKGPVQIVQEPKEPKRELEWSPAPEVRDIANELIPEYHEHLINVRIEYVFRSMATKKSGKVVAAKARKITGLTAFLAHKGEPDEQFFVIEAAADIWKTLTPEQRKALVDHELQHCWRDEDTGKLSTLPPRPRGVRGRDQALGARHQRPEALHEGHPAEPPGELMPKPLPVQFRVGEIVHYTPADSHPTCQAAIVVRVYPERPYVYGLQVFHSEDNATFLLGKVSPDSDASQGHDPRTWHPREEC